MGSFALATCVGLAYDTNGPAGIMQWLRDTYFGDTLLFFLGTGLAAYAIYKFYSALADTRDEGQEAQGVGNRLGWVVNGFVYATLSYSAFRLIWTSDEQDDVRKDIIALVLQYSWGEAAVLVTAAVVAGVGLFQAWIALRGKHMKFIETGYFGTAEEAWYRHFGLVGIGATSVIYLIMAYFLYRAAKREDGEKFRGVGESLEVLEWGSLSAALLLVMGLGLVAYSLFMLVMARYGKA